MPGVPTMVSPPSQVFVQDGEAVSARYCWLTLYDSQGKASDEKQVH